MTIPKSQMTKESNSNGLEKNKSYFHSDLLVCCIVIKHIECPQDI